MDDDGSKNLDYQEFKKGLHDYGLSLEESVSAVEILWLICNFHGTKHF